MAAQGAAGLSDSNSALHLETQHSLLCWLTHIPAAGWLGFGIRTGGDGMQAGLQLGKWLHFQAGISWCSNEFPMDTLLLSSTNSIGWILLHVGSISWEDPVVSLVCTTCTSPVPVRASPEYRSCTDGRMQLHKNSKQKIARKSVRTNQVNLNPNIVQY